jgi:hypothetical protein
MTLSPDQMAFDGIDDHVGVGECETSVPVSTVRVAGRQFDTSPVFDTYWRFAARRQQVYEARLAGLPGPWTSDPVLRIHRFTNCFRAADRVSQFLIREVAYAGSQQPDELVFRVLLFKLFNKIETWQLLTQHCGFPTLDRFDVARCGAVLDEAFALGQRLYSAAYVVPPPQLGADRKHRNHLRLLDHMMNSGLTHRLRGAGSMSEAFEALKAYPAMGDFLAFQFLIDINYSTALEFDEMDFVVAGPGARDGIRKCFGAGSAGHERELIEYMAASQEEHFERLGLSFRGLFGRRLQLIDCQNLFCEVDKYARVRHPDVPGYSGRTRIKQKFRPVAAAVSAWFPPKWRLTVAPQVPATA